MTGPVDLDGIEARARAATPGPWRVVFGNEIHAGGQREVVGADLDEDYYPTAHVHIRDADAEFIAHAREDVPALVAEVRALRAKIDAVEALHFGGYGSSSDEAWGRNAICTGCESSWPCGTVSALAGERVS